MDDDGATDDGVVSGERNQFVEDIDVGDSVLTGHDVAQIADVALLAVGSSVRQLQQKKKDELRLPMKTELFPRFQLERSSVRVRT